MNTTIKLLIIAAAALIGLSACNQDNERVSYDESTSVAYSFLQTNIVTELTPDNNGVLQVTVSRTNATVAATVAMKLTASTATNIAELFALTTNSISFEAGAYEAGARVEFTLNDLAPDGTQYPFTLEFNDPETPISIGGNNKTTIKASRKLTWVNAGTGQWTDGIIVAGYSVPVLTYPVSVQRAEEAEGLYRLVNPYGFGVYEYTEAAEVVADPCYVLIDAIDPDRVVIPETGIGINWGDGEFFIASRAYATRSGKTITFAAQTLVVGERNYNNGQPYAYNKECVLVLP
ncbi:MAG: hypothetical protein LBU42_00025 [Prevotellaceae bacterium]|jgi:hypothetical protein|nr:hypothetical protein [Prevotellaceae bacterium]